MTDRFAEHTMMGRWLRRAYRIFIGRRAWCLLIRKTRFYPPSIYRYLRFWGDFEFRAGSTSLTMRNYGFLIESDLFWNGIARCQERGSLAIWCALCRRSNVIIDCGANTGMYALLAKAVQPTAMVVAIEPVKRNFDKLQLNCTLNRYDIACKQVAVSNYDGQGKFYDTPNECVYSVALNKKLEWVTEGTIETPVSVMRLRTIMAAEEIARVDAIKIDVETHEAEVLEGLGESLRTLRPTLLMEILNDDVGRRCEAILAGLDYQFYNIDEAHGARRVPHLGKGVGANYLVCRAEVARFLIPASA